MTDDGARGFGARWAFRAAWAAERAYVDVLTKAYAGALIGWLAYFGIGSSNWTDTEAAGWLAVLALLFVGIACCLRSLRLAGRQARAAVAQAIQNQGAPQDIQPRVSRSGRASDPQIWACMSAWLLGIVALLIVALLGYALFASAADDDVNTRIERRAHLQTVDTSPDVSEGHLSRST